MTSNNQKPEADALTATTAVGSGDLLGVWFENAICFLEALLLAIRLIEPQLPKWMLRIAVRENAKMITVYDFGELQINKMHPLDILRKEGLVVLVRRLWIPLLKWTNLFGLTIVMYRWLKLDRASKAAAKTMRECVTLAHTPNEKS